jgi:hypothetical protein
MKELRARIHLFPSEAFEREGEREIVLADV